MKVHTMPSGILVQPQARGSRRLFVLEGHKMFIAYHLD